MGVVIWNSVFLPMAAMQKIKKIKKEKRQFENPLEVELVAILHCKNFSHEETEKGLYFRRLFRYCYFGMWMKIINYLLSFDFWFFFTYSGVFNKNPVFGYVNSSAIWEE